MPVYNGTNKINKIYYGANRIGKVFYGTNQVWSDVQDLGKVTISATGDYGNNYYSTARAYLLEGKYLKITGYWRSKGNSASSDVMAFKTNINVGTQKAKVSFKTYNWNNTETPSEYTPWTNNDAYVATNGDVYLPLSHESVYNVFNQFDYKSELITLNPK